MIYKEYTCFFVSPISQPGTDIRKNSDLVKSLLLTPALTQCGFSTDRIVRSDELGTANIQDDMKAHLDNDELCIVDITGLNPNVMYEFGYRRGLGKALIVIANEKTKTPFDISADRIVRYDLESVDALSKLPSAIEALRKQAQDRISAGFVENNGSINEIVGRLASIEKKLNDVLAKPISTPSLESSNNVREIIRQLGSPIAAFNYALRGRDVALAEALLPRLETSLPKDRYLDEAVASVASLGSSRAAAILKSEWEYISENLTIQQQCEELGSLVSYCNRRDCEMDEIDFVIKEADRLLTAAETDKQKAHIYNQINRISFGAYTTNARSGHTDERDLDRAIDALQKAVSLNPEEPSFYFNLATCYQEKKDNDAAVEAIQKCMDLESDDEDHLTLAFQIYQKCRMYKEAQEVKERLRKINSLRADTLV